MTRELAAEARRWNVREVVGDAFSGAWVEEEWTAHKFAYRTAKQSKSQYYVDLVPMLTTGKAKLLDNERLLSQFGSFLRRTTRTAEIVDHPRGGYFDDLCNAAAGALVEAGAKAGMAALEARFRALGGSVGPAKANIFYPDGAHGLRR